jgi:hypothetical protein
MKCGLGWVSMFVLESSFVGLRRRGGKIGWPLDFREVRGFFEFPSKTKGFFEFLSLSKLEWFDRAEPTELRLRSVKVGSRQCGWINNSLMPSEDSKVKAMGFQ